MAQDDAAGLLDWEELARSVRLIRFDARGHGGSETSLAVESSSWPELARDLWALVDASDAPTAALSGLSMGCATALHAAAQQPGRVEALVLVAPPTAWETRARQARMYRMMASAIERFGLGPFRALSFLSRLAPAPAYLAQLRNSVIDNLRRADPRSVAIAFRGAASSDLPSPDALRRVRAPTLVLAWRGDATHPVSTAEKLAAILPNAELRVAGTLEEIHSWSSAISTFLADLKPLRTGYVPPS
jgi:pimeloyl-ACP methyl ester carboxylesterase